MDHLIPWNCTQYLKFRSVDIQTEIIDSRISDRKKSREEWKTLNFSIPETMSMKKMIENTKYVAKNV
jgi:hypothetical protein